MSDRTTKHCDVCGEVIEPSAAYLVLAVRRTTSPESLDVCSRVCLGRAVSEMRAMPELGVKRGATT